MRREEERKESIYYLGTFKNIRKLYPRANCNLEKYSPLKMREAGGDNCGPWSVYAQPKFKRNKDQYVQIDMYDNAKKDTACITTAFFALWGL